MINYQDDWYGDLYHQSYPTSVYYQRLIEGMAALETMMHQDAELFAIKVMNSPYAEFTAECMVQDMRALHSMHLAPELRCIAIVNAEYSAAGIAVHDFRSLIGTVDHQHYLHVLHKSIMHDLPRLRDSGRRAQNRRYTTILKELNDLCWVNQFHSIRLDLFYDEPVRGLTSFEMLREHCEAMKKLIAEEEGLYQCIYKIEFGLHKGFHIHLWLFYEARAFQYDSRKAHELGTRWRDEITGGLGAFYSTNLKESREQLAASLGVSTDALCLGRVSLMQPELHMHALNLAHYLSKSEQSIPVKPNAQTQCFGVVRGASWPSVESAAFMAHLNQGGVSHELR